MRFSRTVTIFQVRLDMAVNLPIELMVSEQEERRIEDYSSLIINEAACARHGIELDFNHFAGSRLMCTFESTDPPASETSEDEPIDVVKIRALHSSTIVTHPSVGGVSVHWMEIRSTDRGVHRTTYGGDVMTTLPCPYYRLRFPLLWGEFEHFKPLAGTYFTIAFEHLEGLLVSALPSPAYQEAMQFQRVQQSLHDY